MPVGVVHRAAACSSACGPPKSAVALSRTAYACPTSSAAASQPAADRGGSPPRRGAALATAGPMTRSTTRPLEHEKSSRASVPSLRVSAATIF